LYRYIKINAFFDLACGHGFVGVLLAYAYPERKVMACDRFRRPAFDIFVRAFGAFAAGLYKLNPVYPQLESAWFQPLRLSSENLVSNFAFQIQLVPLPRGGGGSRGAHADADAEVG
jgi:hypothetical protein